MPAKKKKPRKSDQETQLTKLSANIEKFEHKDASLNAETLGNMDHDELKEMYLSFSDVEDTTSMEKVRSVMGVIEIEPIEKAKLGHRIWTYFYEKMPLRFFILTCLFLLGGLKKAIPRPVAIVDPDNIAQMPAPLKSFLYIETPEGMVFSLGVLITLFILLGGLILWRFWLSYLESRANPKHPGSSKLRRDLGITIVNKNGKPLSWVQSFLRGLFRIFPLSLITVASLEISKQDRGIHDILFNSYVLRLNEDVTPDEIAHFIRNNYHQIDSNRF